MRNLKRLKEIFLGFIVVSFIVTGTYLAEKSSLSRRHRRSPNQGNDDASSPPLVREDKISPKVDVPSSPSNPLTGNANIKAGLQQVNESNSGAIGANSSVIANNVTSSNLTTPSSKIALNSTSITVSTSAVNQTTAYSAQTTSPITTAATSTLMTTSPISKMNGTTNPATRSTASTSSEGTPTSSHSDKSKDQLSNQTSSTVTANNSNATNETLQEPTSGEGGLTPTLAAIVGLGCGLVFFVMIYAVFRLVKNFKTFRFRRLHEMPMDDFDDYSGVYVEHTVPIRG